MSNEGTVVVFEGPDGVGKTTITEAVRAKLASRGYPVKSLSFPGRLEGTLGAHIHELHHRPEKVNIRAIESTALQLLHVAAHVDNLHSQIRPHVEHGGIVLLDRSWWSTWVYGRLGGVSDESLKMMIELERTHWRGVEPRVVFLVSGVPRRLDAMTGESFRRETTEYEALAATTADETRVVRLENVGSIEAVAAVATGIIKSLLSGPTREPSGSAPVEDSKAATQPATTAGQLPFDCEGESVGLAVGPPLAVWRRAAPPKPTAVFDTYWRFAAERQAMFYRRFRGASMPWTADPVLARHKFTNVYRASDRVSQYLIRHVIYSGDQAPTELFFRTILFKLFNRIETWQRLSDDAGELRARTFDSRRYDRILTNLREAGETLYSGAYIMPTGGRIWGDSRKHRMHLRLLEHMLAEQVPEKIQRARTMNEAFEVLRSLPTIGDFLAYQYVIDLNYSTLTNFGESDFVQPGPGARDGIRKCFSDLGRLTEADVIRLVCERQDEEFELRGLRFQRLWGRPMQLIDCQNVFCEVDKYARVRHPDVKGKSGRTRIKQQFRPSHSPVEYWYPPKWGLNDRIEPTRVEGVEVTSLPFAGGARA